MKIKNKIPYIIIGCIVLLSAVLAVSVYAVKGGFEGIGKTKEGRVVASTRERDKTQNPDRLSANNDAKLSDEKKDDDKAQDKSDEKDSAQTAQDKATDKSDTPSARNADNAQRPSQNGNRPSTGGQREGGQRGAGNFGGIMSVNQLMEAKLIDKAQATKIIAVLEKYKSKDVNGDNMTALNTEVEKLITTSQKDHLKKQAEERQKAFEERRQNRENNGNSQQQERQPRGQANSGERRERPAFNGNGSNGGNAQAPSQENMNARYKERLQDMIDELKKIK